MRLGSTPGILPIITRSQRMPSDYTLPSLFLFLLLSSRLNLVAAIPLPSPEPGSDDSDDEEPAPRPDIHLITCNIIGRVSVNVVPVDVAPATLVRSTRILVPINPQIGRQHISGVPDERTRQRTGRSSAKHRPTTSEETITSTGNYRPPYSGSSGRGRSGLQGVQVIPPAPYAETYISSTTRSNYPPPLTSPGYSRNSRFRGAPVIPPAPHAETVSSSANYRPPNIGAGTRDHSVLGGIQVILPAPYTGTAISSPAEGNYPPRNTGVLVIVGTIDFMVLWSFHLLLIQ